MKRLLVVILILAYGSVHAADFVLTLSDYRSQIKRKLNVDPANSTWMTDTVMNQLIREAIVTVNPRIAGVKVTKTFLTTTNRMSYPIDTTVVDVFNVGWKSNDTVRWFTQMPMEKWSGLSTQNTWGAPDAYLSRPSVFDMTYDSIYLFPIPTLDGDTIMYIGSQKITGITTRDTIGTILQELRVPILDWATFLVAQAKQDMRWPYLKVQADSSVARMNK